MVRTLIIAYFSLLTALGPAVCCCNFRHLTTGVDGKSCCGKVTAKSHHHDHSGHGHAHQQGANADHHHDAPSTPNDSVPTNDQDCPCGRQEPPTIAASESELLRILEQHATFSVIFDFSTATLPLADFVESLANLDVRPASMSGREILRAYSIMRC